MIVGTSTTETRLCTLVWSHPQASFCSQPSLFSLCIYVVKLKISIILGYQRTTIIDNKKGVNTCGICCMGWASWVMGWLACHQLLFLSSMWNFSEQAQSWGPIKNRKLLLMFSTLWYEDVVICHLQNMYIWKYPS